MEDENAAGSKRGNSRTPSVTRKTRRGQSRPGGVTAPCGCRYARTGGEWRHVTPCRSHRLRDLPASDEEMRAIA